MVFHTFPLRTFFAFASLAVPLAAAPQPVCTVPALAEMPGSPVALGDEPYPVVTFDGNQDGFADLAWLAIPNRVLPDPTPLWVALSDGQGGYNAPYEVAEFPYSTVLAARDVNGDAREDLLVFPSSHKVQTALSDGAGGFSVFDASSYPTNPSGQPYFADLDDDDLVDLILPTITGNWQIYSGNGDGTFLETGTVRPLTYTGDEAGVGDVNGDGIDDFAFPSSPGLGLRYSEGGQRFAQITSFAVAESDPLDSAVYGIVAGNFNGDQYLDFAGVGYNFVHLWFGDGALGFTASSFAVNNPALYEIRGVDLTGDGLTDLLLRDNETHQWFAMATQPGGSFSGVLTPVARAAYGSSVDLRDIDGDSRNDVLLWSFSSDQVRLLRNTCPLQLTSSFSPDPGFACDPIDYQFTVKNVGDQATAALDWSLAAPPEVIILGATPSAGSCATATSCTIGPLDPGAAVQIDVSAQLAADAEGFTGPTATVVATDVGPFSWRARHWSTVRASGPVPSRLGVFSSGQWFLDRDGDTLFDPATEVSGWGSSGDIPVEGDWNGDGYRDLGVFSRGTWFRDINGDGEFDPTTEIQVWGLNTWIPIVGDWNGDGKSDLGVVEPSTMAWFRDLNGDGVFDPATEVTVWGSPGNTPVVGDWDGDGDDDIGVFASGLWFRDLNGDGAFDPATEIEGWGTGSSVPAVGDWNGDGADDLGVYADGIWFRDLDGNGVFDPATEISGWGLPGFQPIVEDWDGDGDDDLAIYADGIWFADFNGDGAFDPDTEQRGWGSFSGSWNPAAGAWK